jgi:uncharacterized ferritin-like protein (DUF455 family)
MAPEAIFQADSDLSHHGQVCADTSVQSGALAVLLACDVAQKLALTQTFAQRIASGACSYVHPHPMLDLDTPGRPALPELVAPKHLAQRKLGSAEGRAVLLHAVAHIEFNAINLAWDAIYRFPGLPQNYYQDWASVAADEARHFSLLNTRLSELGYRYGDFPAHNGLWQMAINTRDDLLTRMALVPRLLEARGLDVTPGMIYKLEHEGDSRAVEILTLILSEEIGHVEIGSRWFRFACEAAGKPVSDTFLHLLETRAKGMVRGPFNRAARLAAGFSSDEVDALERFHA